MNITSKAYLIGGGIGSLAAAAFMVRDTKMPDENIFILEAAPVMGGNLNGAGDPDQGYSMYNGRMLTIDDFECTWDLFKSIPSLNDAGKTVFEETREFNEKQTAHSMARLINRHCAKIPATSMGLSMHDRTELQKFSETDEELIAASRISDWLSPGFFETEFWSLWSATFAFQPWHSAVEFKRFLLRFILEFSRNETLGGIKRTIYNQYDSLVLPLQSWLLARGVHMVNDCTVTELDHTYKDGLFTVTGIHCLRGGITEVLAVKDDDLVFMQNGSMTEAASLGSMTSPPEKLFKAKNGGWSLWERTAKNHSHFGKPAIFSSRIAQTCWESFTVTLKESPFFDMVFTFIGNGPGTGGLVSFKDSNWQMSIVLAHQPHFRNQPEGVQVFWGYALTPDRIGNFIAKPMSRCNGMEILTELCGHLQFDIGTVASAICIPCIMPYATSMFMPRTRGDLPLPVPPGSGNLAFISQFVEIADDIIFTVEYAVRAAQMAVYALLHIDRAIPTVSPHPTSLHLQFDALMRALR